MASAGQSFDANGVLTDETVKKLLTKFVQGFAAFVAR